MIGQQNVIEKLRTTKARSVLLTGPAHWGKKTLLRELFKKEESVFEVTGNAATFRETLERIYQTVRPTIYIIPDVDRQNATIQNLLLKVLEEPPHEARFFLTASGAVLPTITSRCVTYRMEPYKHTAAELDGLPCQPGIMGLFKSPGERILLDVEGIQLVTQQLAMLKSILDNHGTLANLLKTARELTKVLAEYNISHDAFLMLAPEFLGTSEALERLREMPQDGVKYTRTAYFMHLWAERQVLE